MRKIVPTAVVALIVAAVGWWYASPLWTLRAMRDAARDRDASKLSAYVDYPALRTDLHGDLNRYILAEAGKRSAGDGGKLGAAIALAFVDPMVDAMVSPEGVEAMFAREKQADASMGRARVPVAASDDPVIERDGLDRFRVYGKDRSKGALLFHRSGLGWKLAGVDLPPPTGG